MRETNGATISPKPFRVVDLDSRGRWRVDQSHWPSLSLRIRQLQATELYAKWVCGLADELIWLTEERDDG